MILGMQNKTFDKQVMSDLLIERFLLAIIRTTGGETPALVTVLGPVSTRRSMYAAPKFSGVGEYGWL